MNEVILLINVGLFLIRLFIKKIVLIIVKLVVNMKDGIIIENNVLIMMLCFVKFLFILLNVFNWFFFCIKDFIIWIFSKFFFVMLFIWLISFWMIMKCLFICVNESVVIRNIVMISVMMIYYNCGIVIIVKMKVLINKNGIWKSDCKEIIIKFWICVILFVRWIIRFLVENCLIFLNENVWIFWKVFFWIFVFMFWVIFVEKIVFVIFVVNFSKVRLIR